MFKENKQKSNIWRNDQKNIDELIHEIVEIDNNNLLYNHIINQPLFSRKIHLDSIKENIFKIL